MRRPVKWFGIKLGDFWLCSIGGWGWKEVAAKFDLKTIEREIKRIQRSYPNAKVVPF